MDDPDVIVRIDPHADGLAEHPVIGQRLRPQRIDFEARRLHAGLRLRGGRFVEHRLGDGKSRECRSKSTGEQEIPSALQIVHHRLPREAQTSHRTLHRATP